MESAYEQSDIAKCRLGAAEERKETRNKKQIIWTHKLTHPAIPCLYFNKTIIS